MAKKKTAESPLASLPDARQIGVRMAELQHELNLLKRLQLISARVKRGSTDASLSLQHQKEAKA